MSLGCAMCCCALPLCYKDITAVLRKHCLSMSCKDTAIAIAVAAVGCLSRLSCVS